jgi:hypothetical protein
MFDIYNGAKIGKIIGLTKILWQKQPQLAKKNVTLPRITPNQ